MNKVNINNVTPIRDEFDLNGSIKAHFTLIKTHPSGRRAYLRTEKSGVTSIEVVQPVKKKHPVTGETYYAYPSTEQFGAFGAYISVRNEMKRNEMMEYYLERGFDVPFNQASQASQASQHQKEHNIK